MRCRITCSSILHQTRTILHHSYNIAPNSCNIAPLVQYCTKLVQYCTTRTILHQTRTILHEPVECQCPRPSSATLYNAECVAWYVAQLLRFSWGRREWERASRSRISRSNLCNTLLCNPTVSCRSKNQIALTQLSEASSIANKGMCTARPAD